MAAAAIKVDGLSKRYRIGQLQSGYDTLRDSLTHATRRLLRDASTGHRQRTSGL